MFWMNEAKDGKAFNSLSDASWEGKDITVVFDAMKMQEDDTYYHFFFEVTSLDAKAGTEIKCYRDGSMVRDYKFDGGLLRISFHKNDWTNKKDEKIALTNAEALAKHVYDNFDSSKCYKGHIRFEDSPFVAGVLSGKNPDGSAIREEYLNDVLLPSYITLDEVENSESLKESDMTAALPKSYSKYSKGGYKVNIKEQLSERMQWVVETMNQELELTGDEANKKLLDVLLLVAAEDEASSITGLFEVILRLAQTR